jgi:hypothetical protein
MLDNLLASIAVAVVLGLGYWAGHRAETKAEGPASEAAHVEPVEHS